MDNRTRPENGQVGGRFGDRGGSEHPPGNQNPLGTNVPSATGTATGAATGAENDDRPFRRLTRSAQGQGGGYDRGGGAGAGFGSGYGLGDPGALSYDRSQSRYDQERSRGYPERGFTSDRNRERQWDDQTMNRIQNEGDASRFHNPQDRQNWQNPQEWQARQDWQGRQDRQDRQDQQSRADRNQDDYQRFGEHGDRTRHQRSSWWQREALTVADVMTTNIKSVDPDATAREIAEIMRQEDVGVVPVVKSDGRLYGLVTDRDIVLRGFNSGTAIDECRAKDLATRDLEVASPEDPLSDVINLMGRQQIRRVPVVNDRDKLIGIVSLADVANRADQHDDLQRAFEKISGRRSFWSRIWR